MTTVLPFPNRRGGHQRPATPAVDINRRPVREAADWQLAIIAECRRHDGINPGIVAFLKSAGLLPRCTFLAGGPGEPLTFRFIGMPTITALGPAWARRQLGQPEEADPLHTFATAVGEQYREAMHGGEPVFNRVCTHGVAATPFAYDHTLIGWALPAGARAVLSAVTLH